MVLGDADSRRRVRRGNRALLVGLVAVFVVPVFIAYGLNVWWPHWSPFGRMNHGELVEPAWKVEFVSRNSVVAEQVAGRWILLHPIEGPCAETCQTFLDLTKRVHISLGKNHDRVARMFVYRIEQPPDDVRAMDPALIPVPAPAAWFDRFAGEAPALLLVDPKGQAVLRYPANLQSKGLSRDLARVLKISKIG